MQSSLGGARGGTRMAVATGEMISKRVATEYVDMHGDGENKLNIVNKARSREKGSISGTRTSHGDTKVMVRVEKGKSSESTGMSPTYFSLTSEAGLKRSCCEDEQTVQ